MGRKGAGGLRHRVEGERRGRRDRCVLEGEDARRGIGGEGHLDAWNSRVFLIQVSAGTDLLYCTVLYWWLSPCVS